MNETFWDKRALSMKIGTDIPKDNVLPQLDQALNCSVMMKVFQETLFSERRKYLIKGCTIERVRYQPGKKCMVSYQLEIRDVLTGHVDNQRLCTRIFEQGGAISRFTKAKSQSVVKPKFGRPVSYISKLEMVVWAFPNDRKLHGLPKITDPIFVKDEILPGILGTILGLPWRIVESDQAIVHYVPEHTCTVCVHLKLRNSQTKKKQTMTLFGKTYYNQEGQETYHSMQQLWDSKERSAGQLVMARPLGYHLETRTLWQEGLPGRTLMSQKMDSPHFLKLLRGAASTVGSLHMADLSCSRVIHVSDMLDKLQSVKQLLSDRRPTCKIILDPLTERLIRQAEHLEPLPDATLHGDLHLDNIFEEDGKIALIDMDNLCHGSPLMDVGSFIAGILYRGILTQLSTNKLDKITETFIRHYDHSVTWKVSRSALKWYVAIMLLNERAFRCLTRLKAGRLDILDDLIDLADKISLGKREPFSQINRA